MNGTYENIDCMELMANLKDKEIDLAIVDPPYGIGAGSTKFKNGTSKNKTINYKIIDWDYAIPDNKYFKELCRVSKNQIIWGGNYFSNLLNNSQCWVFWDKGTGDNSYADGELAWTSFNSVVKKFFHSWVGANAKNITDRIHPTEKPVKLYEWLLTNYAKQGDLILDTHVGSASSLIACENLGFKYIASELDKDYYSQSLQRLEAHLAQGKLFQRVGRDEIRLEQPSMFA